MKNGVLKFSITPRTGYLVVLCMIWSLEIVPFYSRVVLAKLFGGSHTVGYAILIIFTILALFLGLPYFLKRLQWRDIITVAVFELIYFVTMTATENYRLNRYLVEQAYLTMLVCIPMFLMGVCIESEDIPILHRMSQITIVAFTLYFIVYGKENGAFQHEDMNSAYALLPHICMLTYFSVREKKILDVVLMLYGLALLLFMGTRGPVLLVSLFFILCFVLYSGTTKLSKAITIFALVVAVTLLIVFLDEILDFFIRTAESWGMSTRVFERLREGEFTNSSGRDRIQSDLMQAVWKQPITGYGLAYDRILTGHYAHNIVVEFWVSYGIIAGTLLFGWIVWKWIAAVLAYKNDSMQTIVLVLFFSNGMGKIMFSSSYFLEHWFFLLLGVIFSVKRRQMQDESKLQETAKCSCVPGI